MRTERHRVGAAQHLVREKFVGHRRLGAEALQDGGSEVETAPAAGLGQERERRLVVCRRELIELTGQLLDRFVPGDVDELPAATLARSLLRPVEAIGVVRDLYRRLAAGAQLALADRILR